MIWRLIPSKSCSHSQSKNNFCKIQRPRTALAAGTMRLSGFRSWEKQQDKEQNYNHRLQMRPAWQDLWEVGLESRGPEELANLQGQPPQSIRTAIRMFRQFSNCGRKPTWRTWSYWVNLNTKRKHAEDGNWDQLLGKNTNILFAHIGMKSGNP